MIFIVSPSNTLQQECDNQETGEAASDYKTRNSRLIGSELL